MALSDQPKWKWIVTAMDGTIPTGAGELLRTSQKTYSDPLNGARTASCSIPIDSPRANFLLSNDALLKLYRLDRNNNWTLLLRGDVVSTEEAGDGNGGNITVVASDPFFRLTKRLLGMAVNAQNQGTGFTIGTPTVPVDLSLAVSQALTQVNTDAFSGIAAGTVSTCGTLGVVGPLYSAFAGPTIQQICATLGGPDFWIQPVEGTGTMPNNTIGQMNIQFARGVVRPNAIFEYGMGRFNVDKYSRLLTKQNMCNHAVSLPNGWPSSVSPSDQVVMYEDTTSQNRAARFDDVVSTDVNNVQLRTILAQENVGVRKQKQQQITFQPTVDNPMDYTVDYNVGDVVTARSFDINTNTFRFNGSIRVYGVAVTLGDNNEETTTLTLIPDSVAGGAS